MPSRPTYSRLQNIHIGVDPGKQGGIAVLICERNTIIKIEHYVMPPSTLDLWSLVESFSNTPRTYANIEHVGSMPGEGHKGAFTFGRGVGRLEMAFAAAKIPLEVVTPKKWQGSFLIQGRKKGEPKPLLKERCRAKAQAIYPNLGIWKGTLGLQRAICDALLIATYGMRMRIKGDAKIG